MPAVTALRLLYVVDRFPELSETFVVRELRELQRGGDRVRVYARAPGGAPAGHESFEEVLPAVSYRPGRARRALAVAAALLATPRGALRAARWGLAQRRHERGLAEAFADACTMRAEASAADHIHAHFTHWPASAAVMASLLTGTPCSFTAHARDIFCANPDALRRKVERSRFAVTVSEHTREALAVAAPAHAHAIQVVRNGVDLSRYRPRRAGGASDPLVLTVARLVDKKGVDVVVEACARSAAAASWLVIGEGPRRAALERRSAEACAGRVGFTGAAGAGEVAAALARATVFALPCRVASDGDRDALPVALVEAMAAGLPVVTTAVGGIPELVRDGESGLLVPPDDPDALAVAIDRLLGDPGLREQLGSGALADVAGYDLPGCIADLRGRMAA